MINSTGGNSVQNIKLLIISKVEARQRPQIFVDVNGKRRQGVHEVL